MIGVTYSASGVWHAQDEIVALLAVLKIIIEVCL
jgi:hypothetical protein